MQTGRPGVVPRFFSPRIECFTYVHAECLRRFYLSVMSITA